jgi:hypothetical protein
MAETTNYNLKKPGVGSFDWGEDVNANFDTIDGQMKTNADAAASAASSADAKIPTTYLDTDGSLTANSDTKVATQKATKTYADTKVSSVSGSGLITSSGGTTPTIGTSMSTSRLLGRSTAEAGAIEEIVLGTNLSFDGTTLNASGGGASVTTLEFDDDDLSGGILTISAGEHSIVEIRDNNGYVYFPDDIYRSGGETMIDLTSFGAITGTHEVDYI